MSASGFQLSRLHDSRLAPLATSALPAWLWSTDGSHVVWANAAGAAALGAPDCAAIGARRFDTRQPEGNQIARLAATLLSGASPRLERLQGFGAGAGSTLICACSRFALGENASAILVVAIERAGPDLSLGERVSRLLAGGPEPIAVFALDGALIAASDSARPQLRGAATLAALGVQAAIAGDALAGGFATASIHDGRVSIERVGEGDATVLAVVLTPPRTAGESAQSSPPATPAGPAPAVPVAPESLPPESPAERHHPLRFVWQMDEDGRFTLGSDEFITLSGPSTASANGRPWQEVAEQLRLDPEGQVARAIATHDTWSGLAVPWPVDGSREPLPVELSGLPVFDRDRVFRGYRGFGVCRDIGRLTALAQPKQSVGPDAPSVAAAARELPHIDSQATPRAGGRPAFLAASSTENIVRFPVPAVEPAAPSLSPIERNAFRELSRKLSQRLTATGVAHEPRDETLTAADEDAVIAETLLAGSMADARLIFDKLTVGVLICRHGQPVYANPAFLQWSGHRNLSALAEASGVQEMLTAPSGGAAGDKGELLNVVWEGEPAQALLTAAPSGQERLTSVQADLAELSHVLDAAADGVILLDRQGVMLSANRGAQALFGYAAQELVGRALSELVAPESAEVIYRYLDDLTRDGVANPPGGREILGRVRPGGLIPVFMTMRRIGEQGDKLCAVFRDIRRWKKVEEELTEAKRQAERASSAKSDFLAAISHEIRTPLNAIIGFSEVMMEERLGPIGTQRYREYLKDIHASGGHLLSLINDLLDLSKIEAGKLELTLTAVALNDVTQQCVAIMQPQAGRNRIIIRTSLLPALPQVEADARSVRQIVLNLLSNSIKFTDAGGQVIISTAVNDNGEVVLRVRDSGIGMSEKDLVIALEPFGQLTTSSRADGTGLGLPLTKALAQANRASFHIKSAPKAGTLVEIAFPAHRVLAG
jgi:PAS domain S-box-containing protein